MALFGDNQLSKDQQRNVTLAQIGGGVTGLGVGALAAKGADAFHEKKLLERGLTQSRDKEIAAGNWETLMALYKGELSLEDLPLGKKDYFTKDLQENADDLAYYAKNPMEFRKALEQLNAGRVQPIAPDQSPSLLDFVFNKGKNLVDLRPDNVVPLFEGANEHKLLTPHPIQSPKRGLLMGGAGLAGMAGAGSLLQHQYHKQNEREQPEKDLQKLEELLLALKTKRGSL